MDRSPGLIDSVRGLAQTLLGAVRTRLELLSNELEEQSALAARMTLFLALAGFCLALAVVLGVLLLVVIFWDTNRVAVLAILTGAFGAVGIGLIFMVRSLAKSRPRVFSRTLAELARDSDALQASEKQL